MDFNEKNAIKFISKIEKAQRQTVNKSTPIIENIRLKYKSLLIPIDNDFNQLETLNIRSRLNSDIIPSIGALKVNKLKVSEILCEKKSYYQMILEIESFLKKFKSTVIDCSLSYIFLSNCEFCKAFCNIKFSPAL